MPPERDAGEHRRLLSAFLGAARRGNLTALEVLLAQDVVGTPQDDPVTVGAAYPRARGGRRRR